MGKVLISTLICIMLKVVILEDGLLAKNKESDLTKGQLRKLNAYRKSVCGNEAAAMQMFNIWLKNQPKKLSKPGFDPVAKRLTDVLNQGFPDGLRLGNKGYTIKMARGRGITKGFTASKNK